MKKFILILLAFLMIISPVAMAASKAEIEEAYDEGKRLGESDKKSKNEKSDTSLDAYIDQKYKYYAQDKDLRASFKKGYKEGFGSTSGDNSREEDKRESSWVASGKEQGAKTGRQAGLKDVQENLYMDWRRDLPSYKDIIDMYNLSKIARADSNNFIDGYREAYREAYEEAFKGNIIDLNKNRSSGEESGDEAGRAYGVIQANLDYQSGKEKYDKLSLSDNDIINRYNLSKVGFEYKGAFIQAFKIGYREAYNQSYTQALSDAYNKKLGQGSSAGSNVGRELGVRDATIDRMSGAPYSPEKKKPKSDFIIKEYDLNKYNDVYREDFIQAVMVSYVEGYDETYKSISSESATNKVSYQTIELAGGSFSTNDGRMTIEIPGGVFYDTTFLSVESLNPKYLANLGYIEGSRPYRVSLVNPNGGQDDNRKIKLSFEYYGRPKNNIGETEEGLPGNAFNAGIYKLEGSRWKYIDSKIIGDAVVAEVNPSTISQSGNIFALIIDKSYSYLHDIRGHWAKDEINAMVRRGVISGYPDQTFKPDQAITRAEFLILLSRHYDWNISSGAGYSKRYLDNHTFGSYTPYIDYGTSNGYIVGYPDGEYKPNRNISYREIDWIMQRITKNQNFTWQSYAKMLVNEKGVRSNSHSNFNNRITRAEFAYMVYMMDKWKY